MTVPIVDQGEIHLRNVDKTVACGTPDVISWAMASKPLRSAGPKLKANALQTIHLGQSFAEYDTNLRLRDVFVQTPALAAGADFNNPHCFFVGRRGTGKTTITKFVESTVDNAYVIRPEIFSPSSRGFDIQELREANKRPFRSLTAAFRRSLQNEILNLWKEKGGRHFSSPVLAEESALNSGLDFDMRTLEFIDQIMGALREDRERDWVAQVKIPKDMAKEMEAAAIGQPRGYTILMDAIDESWDGSELAVIYLAALMHAALEVNSHLPGARILIFLRENIFERVRVIDTEFSRLETCVVGLDWSAEQLLEMVERRLNAPLTAKFPLGGATWDVFFEGENSRGLVFDFCQHRPRDVLTYTALALDNAQTHKHSRIQIEDLQDARRRFSSSRLSDLGDEYQENFPQIAIVLSRFYGLGQRWTLVGVRSLLEKILKDDAIKSGCASWIYRHSTPEQFARLMYDIGFFGFKTRRSDGQPRIAYRSLGPRDTTPPAITSNTDMVVHPSYWDALELQDVLIREFNPEQDFHSIGLVSDLPGALSLEEYTAELESLREQLRDLPTGQDSASDYEALVGSIIRMCFFRVLSNIEDQVREVDGTIRRDWVVSNRGETGFWEMVRHRFAATQVLWECKNYSELKASDFQQSSYYMTDQAGKLVLLCSRGDQVEKHHFQHIKRINQQCGGLVLPLFDKDLQVFLRQAINGKVKDSHLLDRFDKIQRGIS